MTAEDGSPDANVLSTLIDYVGDGDPDSAVERLEFAAAEAARFCLLASVGRVTVVLLLVLAAETAGISRRTAEAITADAFRGVPR